MQVSKTCLEDLGICLHTALRKCCDDDPTSIVWNAFYIIDDESWRAYILALQSVLYNQEFASKAEVVATIRAVTLLFGEHGFWYRYVHSYDNLPVYDIAKARCSSSILSIAFRQFDVGNDWDAYCSYLTYSWRKR